MSGSSVMPASSRITTVLLSNRSRSWSRCHMSEAMVRLLSMSASSPRLRAAWPEVAVPITGQPDASYAAATTRSMVVFPAPAASHHSPI